MIGDVTNREENNQNEQQLQTSLFLYLVSGICAADNGKYMSIAAQCDEEWDTKPSKCPSKAVFQVILNICLMGGIVAFPSGVSKCFGVEHVWKTLNTHQHPHSD